MKKRTFILLTILFLGFLTAFFLTRQYNPAVVKIGSHVPDIKLVDIKNNTLNLSDLKGSVILINFWATWCPSCIDELPSLEILFSKLSRNPDFKLITILFKDNINKAFYYMKENGYTLPIYSNPDETAAKKFGITGVPETFIIDKNGILRDKKIGPEHWDSPFIIEKIHSLINEPYYGKSQTS